MTPFNWRETPSELAKHREQPAKTTAEQILRDSHGGAYSKAHATEAAEVTDERVDGNDSLFGVLA